MATNPRANGQRRGRATVWIGQLSGRQIHFVSDGDKMRTLRVDNALTFGTVPGSRQWRCYVVALHATYVTGGSAFASSVAVLSK